MNLIEQIEAVKKDIKSKKELLHNLCGKEMAKFNTVEERFMIFYHNDLGENITCMEELKEGCPHVFDLLSSYQFGKGMIVDITETVSLLLRSPQTVEYTWGEVLAQELMDNNIKSCVVS